MKREFIGCLVLRCGLCALLVFGGGCSSNMKRNDVEKSEGELFQELRAHVQEFERRKKYSELSPEILKTIPDDKLVWAVRDFATAAIDEDLENAPSKVTSLGPGFSAVYFVSSLDIEVNNGGFDQFFGNDGRQAVELSKEGAEFMGLRGLATVSGKALSIEERAKREKALSQENVADEDISFDEADDAFTALDLDLDKEMVKFIRRRPELFVGKLK